MIGNMKYIIVSREIGLGLEELYVFSSHIKHDEFVRELGVKKSEIISAGFVTNDPLNAIQCYGKSVSLGLESRPEDTDLLRRELGWDKEDIEEHTLRES